MNFTIRSESGNIHPCNECGLSELFDAPSDLIRKVFPNLPEDGVMDKFTALCPKCGGWQVVSFRATMDQD